MRFDGLDKGSDHLRSHRTSVGHDRLAMGNLRREDCQVHISPMKASPLWHVADRSTYTDLIMEIIDNFIGDCVIQDAACRPNNKMILKAGIRHHSREAVNAGATFKCGEIERVFERHHPGLLFHLWISDDCPPSGLSEPHAGRMADRSAENKTSECQHQHNWQPDKVKPAPPFKPCVKIAYHDDLHLRVM